MFNEQWNLTCSFSEKLWEEGFNLGFKSEKYLLDSWFEGTTEVGILIFLVTDFFFSWANVIKKKLDSC